MSPPTYWHGLRIRGAEDEQLPPHWRGYALFGRGVTEAIHRMQHAPSFAAWTGSRLRAGDLFFFRAHGEVDKVAFLSCCWDTPVRSEKPSTGLRLPTPGLAHSRRGHQTRFSWARRQR